MTEGNILDRIIGSQTQSNLTNFQPKTLVEIVLSMLKERDRQIITHRFGLSSAEIETLEAIGKKYNLTRERVRQIEKDSISFIRRKHVPQLEQGLQLIFDTILDHGSIMAESDLLASLSPSREADDDQAIRFLLCLGDRFVFYKETNDHKEAWGIVGFDPRKLEQVIDKLIQILKQAGTVLNRDELFERFRPTELSDKALKSYLNLSKVIQINPFNEVGLRDWAEVKPRDVGDKAYLVLKHHAKPEHYSVITKLINDHKFDDRTAYQETVHNELIKDNRFVLIGRGIYALTEWGYKKGVVADVITEVIKNAQRPLTRDEIIDQVLKKRQVKRNTILVGLSNRKLFQKVGKDKFTLIETNNAGSI